MLDLFRNAAKTWIVKLLFALLAFSFVAWGVGDFIRRGALGTGPVIKVGSVELSAQEVNAEFKRDVERMQASFGGRLTADEAKKLGFLDATIQTITTRLLVDTVVKKLGLTASDDTVLKAVANDPNLKNDKGQVDRDRLREALSRMGMTEAGFLKIARAEQTRNQLAHALSAGVAAPSVMVDPLFRRRYEQRIAEAVIVLDTAVPVPAAPDAAQIETYYKANTAKFMAPEYRSLTVLLLRPADVDSQITLTDDEIAKAYQQRIAEFNVPERRQVSQILLTDQAQADKAKALVEQGRDLVAVAKTLGVQVIDLGSVDQSALPEPLAGTIFGAETGVTLAPVKSDLGWHVIKVYRVDKAETKSLDQVKDVLVKDLRKDKATELLSDLSNKVEDALGGGASLEEAAKRFSLSVVKIGDIDAKGQGRDGKPAANLPKGPTFLDVAFHTDQGSESQLTENGPEGLFLARVDTVTAPAPKALADVKAEVVAAMQSERRHQDAKVKADAVAAQLKDGAALTAIAKAPGIETKTTEPFTRDAGDASGLPATVVGVMFEKSVGEVAVTDMSDGWAVARLSQIKPADPAAKVEEISKVRDNLSQSIAGDIADAFLAELNERVGVKIDRSQLSREE